jgi:hypothetical protein
MNTPQRYGPKRETFSNRRNSPYFVRQVTETEVMDRSPAGGQREARHAKNIMKDIP